MQSDYPQIPQEPDKEPKPAGQPGLPPQQPMSYQPPAPVGQPVYPPYPPQQGVYPPPYPPQQAAYYPQTRPEHPRVAAVGIMNLVFSFPYLALTVLALIGASNPLAGMGMSTSYEMDFSAILNLVGFGLGGLLLLIGGANLLAHKASGKTLTQAAAGVLTAVMAFNTVVSLTNVSSSYMGSILLSLLIVVGLLLIYPITAAFVINRTPEELGLN